MYLKFLRPHQLQEATARDLPLLIPAGCVETHGPHLAIGHDTLIVEEICARIAGRLQVVIAPPFDFGPTGYALGGPADGTIDPDYESFGTYTKSILRNFLEMGFKSIYVLIMHQGMEGPLALAFKKASAELSFEMGIANGYPRGWWANYDLAHRAARWGYIQVHPMILPEASPPAGGDHAGYNETSFLLATRPELVDQSCLGESAPWYCQKDQKENSWTANVEHGDSMVEAVVNAWVGRLEQAKACGAL